MLADIFGTIAGFLTSIRLIPQVYKSLKTRHTRDLSIVFLVVIFLQAGFLILYGITRPDPLILYGNIVPLVCSIILLYLNARYDKKED